MPITRVLLVDDDEMVSSTLSTVLDREGFKTTVAASVSQALKYISSETFDVLLSDLHMPGAGDGLTVVSAIRHANPKSVTILLSAYPEMNAAAHAILMQADEILVKPMDVAALLAIIKQRLANDSSKPAARVVESVASILERSIPLTIEEWLGYVDQQVLLMTIPLTREQRSSHLPKVLADLVSRLRSFKPLGSKELVSVAAQEHGVIRRQQGYSAAMMVEESRMLQVSIFQTLQKNLASIDFSLLLDGVMTIADEVDSQLSQAMASYIAESSLDAMPA